MVKKAASGYRIGLPGGVFTIRRGPTIMTMVMVVIMIGLGYWQIQRLHWKEGLLASIAAHSHDVPINVQVAAPDSSSDYRPAMAVGIYDAQHTFYLVATSLKGEGGYHVLTPFQLFDGSLLLVDRGWIPYKLKDQPNGFEPPASGGTMVSGILRVPQHGLFQPSNRIDTNDWYWPDLAAMARVAHVKGFLPYILELNARPNSTDYPIAGQTRFELPNNHLEYALTWFGLAVALIIIYVAQGFNRSRKH